MSLLHEPNPLPTHHPKTEQATLLCTTTAETSSLFLTSSHPSDDPSFEYYYKQYYLDSSYNTPSNYSTYLSSSLKLISNFPSNTTQLFHKQLLSKTQSLPFTPYKKTLILDMDETLIHADVDYKFKYHDTILKFKYQDDETGNDEEEINIPLILRPHLFDFLNIVSQQYELILFTASEKAYADAIVDYIEKERKYFNKRLYRDSCLYLNPGLYIKDLSIFDNRKLEDISVLSEISATLTALEIDCCGKIKDFSVLSSLSNLQSLRLIGSNKLPDLSFVKNLPELKVFDFRMNVLDGDLTPCLPIPYVSIQNRKHYNHKDSDFSKLFAQEYN